MVMSIEEKLTELGPEFTLGMDTQRQWATGVQAFSVDGTTLLVFREQNLVSSPSGEQSPTIKNVASIIMPTAVVREFYDMLGGMLNLQGQG